MRQLASPPSSNVLLVFLSLNKRKVDIQTRNIYKKDLTSSSIELCLVWLSATIVK